MDEPEELISQIRTSSQLESNWLIPKKAALPVFCQMIIFLQSVSDVTGTKNNNAHQISSDDFCVISFSYVLRKSGFTTTLLPSQFRLVSASLLTNRQVVIFSYITSLGILAMQYDHIILHNIRSLTRLIFSGTLSSILIGQEIKQKLLHVTLCFHFWNFFTY